MNETTYTLPAHLVQAMADLLGTMPAHTSRGVLNALEGECSRQDQERAAAARQAEIDAAIAALPKAGA